MQLTLDQLTENIFEAPASTTVREHAFGGGVAAQALLAASRTVSPGRRIHSVHCHFLRAGDTTAPTRYEVTPVRDGRSYATRDVVAIEHEKRIFSMTAAFQTPDEGFEHQIPTLTAPEPESLPTLQERTAALGTGARAWLEGFSRIHHFEFRFDGTLPRFVPGVETGPPQLRVWLRCTDELPQDPTTQYCALLYISDLFLLSTGLMPHEVPSDWASVERASLDHAVWFHQEPHVNDWLYYDMASDWAGGGRALTRGRMFDRSGTLVASMMQEVMLRQRARSS